jgi:hypothetical protein
MGPKERRSTVLSPMEEATIVALRVCRLGCRWMMSMSRSRT